jgi:hypothetical protein
MTSSVYFKCGKSGNCKRSCPKNSIGGCMLQGCGSRQQNPAQARVYSLTPGGAVEEEEYTDVVAGTISEIDSIRHTT